MMDMTYEEAWELLCEYNKEPFHLQHAKTVACVMEWYANKLGYENESDFWKIVGLLHDLDFEQYPVDELTGLIGAAALMRPSKSCQDMELKSLKKKYKSTGFAAGCSREVIANGAAMLGWELDRLLADTLEAMKEVEPHLEA